MRDLIRRLRADLRRYVPAGCDLAAELTEECDARRSMGEPALLDASAVPAPMDAEAGRDGVAAVLSPGDRCCLALAPRQRAVLLTTERHRQRLADTLGGAIRDIRADDRGGA